MAALRSAGDGARPGNLAAVVRRYLDAFRDRSWSTLADVLHDDVTLCNYATNLVEVSGRAAVLDALRDAARTPYEVAVSRFEELDERTVLAVGRVRRVAERGGLSDHAAAWLWVVEDGRIVSGRVFDTEDEARAAAAGPA